MTGKFPRGFALFIVFLMLLLLAGYLWLSDIVPKQSPGTVKEDLQNTAANIAPEENLSDWKDYRDPKYGFVLRYPSSWQVSSKPGSDYSVMFSDTHGRYKMNVRAYEKTKLSDITAALHKKMQGGLFPPTDTAKVQLGNDLVASSFVGYSTPLGDATADAAVIAKDSTVFVLEYVRPINLPDREGMFSAWLRSFSI